MCLGVRERPSDSILLCLQFDAVPQRAFPCIPGYMPAKRASVASIPLDLALQRLRAPSGASEAAQFLSRVRAFIDVCTRACLSTYARCIYAHALSTTCPRHALVYALARLKWGSPKGNHTHAHMCACEAERSEASPRERSDRAALARRTSDKNEG